jgi:uncharacterized protein (DUF2267 family)
MAETTTPTEVKMKKILLILMATMLWVCPVWADEIDEALPATTSLQIRNNTRHMIQAGISKDDAIQLTRSMLQHRFQEKYTIQAQNTLMETMQSGLPVDPVMNKAFEGMAKNKPDETIVQAMKKTKSRWTYADRKAQELTTDEETQDRIRMSIAQGMGAGLQDDNIEPVMAQLQTRTRLMSQNKADELCLQTFLTTRTMARLGVDPDTVSDVVSQALQNQFTAREMQQLRSNFNNQSHEMSPNQLANQFSQKLGQGEKPGDSGSSNENNAGQSGSNQGSGSEPGNTSEGMGGSKSGSDTGGSGGSGGSGGGSGKQ